MKSHVPRLSVGLAVALILVGAFVFGPLARAEQPECKAINQAKDVSYQSNHYANPLGEAITAADSGNTIKVIGTCYGSFTVNKDLTLIGRPSRQQTDTIVGGSGGVLALSSGVEVTIRDLTITGGTRSFGYGGGIYNAGTLTIESSTVSGNDAPNGGGIYTLGGEVTLIDSIVSGNDATFGGGIFSYYGDVTLIDSVVTGNTATNTGGGLYNWHGTLNMDANSSLSGNSPNDCVGWYCPA